jgi:hypothetical protein
MMSMAGKEKMVKNARAALNFNTLLSMKSLKDCLMIDHIVIKIDFTFFIA